MRVHGFPYRWVCWAGIVGLMLALAQSANAFYWYGWPGSGNSTPVPVAPKSLPPNPPTNPDGPTTPPPEDPPPDVPTDPKAIPEPGTLLATGIGLAAIGVVRRWKRARKSA